MKETTGRLPNLAPISLHQLQHPNRTYNLKPRHHSHPFWKMTPCPSTPLHIHTLSGNCHHRRSSCVTRLAVMRLSVSDSVNHWQHSMSSRQAWGEGVRQMGGGRQRFKGKKRNTKIIKISSNHSDSAPSFPYKLLSLHPSNCFSKKDSVWDDKKEPS